MMPASLKDFVSALNSAFVGELAASATAAPCFIRPAVVVVAVALLPRFAVMSSITFTAEVFVDACPVIA